MLWDIKGTFVLGGLLVFLGAALMVGAWPDTEIYTSSFLEEPAARESGSFGWALVGAAVAFVGQVLLLIAIIAAGVRIGMDSMDTTDRAATPAP